MGASAPANPKPNVRRAVSSAMLPDTDCNPTATAESASIAASATSRPYWSAAMPPRTTNTDETTKEIARIMPAVPIDRWKSARMPGIT